jgi:hypothetical protein
MSPIAATPPDPVAIVPSEGDPDARRALAPQHAPRPRSFAAVIGLWPSAAELAAVLDVEAVTVCAWCRRGIPARYWAAVAHDARLINRPVDERLFAEFGSLRRFRNDLG